MKLILFTFNKLNVKDFEEASNLKYYNCKVNRVLYFKTSWEILSDLALNNISKINPTELHQCDFNNWKQ